MNESLDVESAVLQVIREIVGKKKAFTLSSSLTNDLNICSDDLSMYFVPQLEQRLNVKVPIAEWSGVKTGGDACIILNMHISTKNNPSDTKIK